MIYISTGGIKEKTPLESVKFLKKLGFQNLELSGGIYDPNTMSDLKSEMEETNFSIHNYFPPPAESFVLNLASLNPSILEQSVQHCLKAIEWAKELGSPTYGVHAGFLIDPSPSELGKKVSKRPLQDRDLSKEVFLKSVEKINEKAKALGIKLLVENNVLSPRNYSEFGSNPFLMADSKEILELMNKLPPEVGLLMDVAHLKVSSTTLNLDLQEEYAEIDPVISAYHLSDNDGTQDSNERILSDSWFLDKIRKDITHVTLEVYDYEPDLMHALVELVNNYVK